MLFIANNFIQLYNEFTSTGIVKANTRKTETKNFWRVNLFLNSLIKNKNLIFSVASFEGIEEENQIFFFDEKFHISRSNY